MTTDTTTSAVERVDIYSDGYGKLFKNRNSHGQYVQASDYDALAAENARLKRDNGEMLAVYYSVITEVEKLRAASAAGWIAGRDVGADTCQKVAEEAKGYGIPQMTMGAYKCADDIRALSPPADDMAALIAMIAEAEKRGWDKAVEAAVNASVRKEQAEEQRAIAAFQKERQ